MNKEELLLSYTDDELDKMRADLNPRNFDSWVAGAESLDPATFLLYRFLATTNRLRAETRGPTDQEKAEKIDKFFDEIQIAIAVDKTQDGEFPKMDPTSKTQRALRGFADSDLWGFDSYLSWMLPNALEQLIDNGHVDYGKKTTRQVRKIIRDLRFYHTNQFNYDDPELWDEAGTRIPKVFHRLGKIFQHLWI